MTQKIAQLTLSAIATTALLAERFLGPGGTVAAAGGHALGVTDTQAQPGERVAYDVLGTSIVTAGAPIALDELVEVGADGKAVPHAAGVAVGRACQVATADGDRFEMFLIPN